MTGPSFLGEEVDVCIIGSGAGGAPMAYELSRAGAKVVVLEKGPWYTSKDFTHDELEVARRDMWTPQLRHEPRLLSTGHQPPRDAHVGWIANCVGGGTAHMSGFFYRFHPEDFRMKSTFGSIEGANLADWPIEYEVLAPYYDRVEREIGISGSTDDNPFEPPRSGPYPMPPLAENPLSSLIDRGARTLGLHPYKTPRAINSTAFQGRLACVYCRFCGGYGCEVGAKGSTLDTLIPRAIETGRCEVRPHCMAFEIATNDRGYASEVRYFDRDGKTIRQKARVIVLSASSIESARLLLNSKSSSFPDGLGNENGLVGKNLMFSTAATGYGLFERKRLPEMLRPDSPVRFIHRSIQDFYRIGDRKGEYDKGGTLNFLLSDNPINSAVQLSGRGVPRMWGASLMNALHRRYRETHEIEFEVYGEFLANETTFVSVAGRKDRWGIPVASLSVNVHPLDRVHSNTLADKALEILRAGGAIDAHVVAAGEFTDVLQYGTCRFGKRKKDSVLDPECRAHEVPNLYVVDGSFMPSSGGVPGTLTILANSFRVADELKKRLSKRDL